MRMLQKIGQRFVLEPEIRGGKIRTEAAASPPTGAPDTVARDAGRAAAAQERSAFEQAPSAFYLSRSGGVGVTFVRFLLRGSIGREVVDNGADLLGREIGPVGHPLLLVLSEERYGSRIARLNHAGGRPNELEQPAAIAPIRDALEVRTHFDAFPVRMAASASLLKDTLYPGGIGGGTIGAQGRQDQKPGHGQHPDRLGQPRDSGTPAPVVR